MRLNKVIISVCLLYASAVFSQQFYKSKGLQLFNEHQYQAACDSMLLWAQDHASEKGIAFYYAAECQYNLGCVQKEFSAIRPHFEKAFQYFESAVKQIDLSTLYPEKKAETYYKLGWSCFRLAEADADPANRLKDAVRYFSESASSSNDSLNAVSSFMAAESGLRRAQILRMQMLLSDNIGSGVNRAQEAVQSLNQSIEDLSILLQKREPALNLMIPCKLKLNDLYYEVGQLYQKMPMAVFTQLTDGVKKNTPEKTAVYAYQYLVKYLSVPTVQPNGLQSRLTNACLYSEAVKRLHLYLITRQNADKQSLNSMLDSLGGSSFQADKAMIQGIRDLQTDVKEDAFIRLADAQTSYFIKASEELSEAWFWFGMTKFLLDDPISRDAFDRFLRIASGKNEDSRLRFLRDHAKYLTWFIEFDHNTGNPAVLQRVKRELSSFETADESLEKKADLLLQLVRLSLGESVWGNILNASTTEERFRDAFLLIQDALVRATRVTGRERVPYLRLLDELFKVTQYKKPDETAFYQGMAMFLKAEIQETAKNKRELYNAAAGTLKAAGGRFENEAKYIQARSIFAGTKYGMHVVEDFDAAKPIFMDLINRCGSLRSVFYLGEILRVLENDLAAKQCYQLVMEKTKDRAEGQFWYQNASAGLSLCKDRGNLAVLQSLSLSKIQFPEFLLQNEQGETISLERFADYDFIRRQYHEQYMDLYLKYGLPKRDLYPSESRMEGSRFARRDFYPQHSGIMEKLGNIESGLKLSVILPKDCVNEETVLLNGQILLKNDQGYYQKSPIPFNSSAEIRVFHPQCYPYIREHVFSIPGIDRLFVPLVRKENFIETTADVSISHLIRFSKRSDRKTVLLPESKLPPVLLQNDFENDIHYRDFAYSEAHSSFISVHAKNENLIQYRNGNRSEFPLRYPKDQQKILSAEGLAVDSKGTLYIADWKGHCIFVFDQQGNFLQMIGQFGRNENDATGKPVRFEFPERIAIVEDLDGVLLDNQKIYRPTGLYILDRNGIHFINERGIYLSTLKPVHFEPGSLSSLSVNGYSRDIRIQVYNRKSNSLIQFTSEP